MKKTRETIDIGELQSAEYNPRKISPERRERLKASLSQFGQVEDIVVDEHNEIIGGHQRWAIMKDLGFKTVDISRVSGLDEKTKKALNITLNNAEAQGEFDNSKLAELLEDIGELEGFEDLGLLELAKVSNIELDDEPEFTAPEEDAEDMDIDGDYPNESGIKMVQLLMKQDQYGDFADKLDELKVLMATDSLTDTVIEAINFAYNELIINRKS